MFAGIRRNRQKHTLCGASMVSRTVSPARIAAAGRITELQQNEAVASVRRIPTPDVADKGVSCTPTLVSGGDLDQPLFHGMELTAASNDGRPGVGAPSPGALCEKPQMADGIYWLRPIVTEGVMRWPACEAQVTDPTGTRNRDMDDRDCALAAKIDYRGKLLCQRHASKLLLREFVKESPERT